MPTDESQKGRRVRLPEQLHQELSAWARARGLDDDDALALAVQAFAVLNPKRAAVASSIAERWEHKDVVGVEDLLLPNVNVLGVRLGAKRPDHEEVPEGLPPRPYVGADLGDDPSAVWSASRAYWRARSDGEYLVGLLVGVPLVTWKVVEWAKLPNGRIYVPDGAGLRVDTTSGNLLDPVTGEPVTAASRLDLDVARALEKVLVQLPRGVANPIVWLRRRS